MHTSSKPESSLAAAAGPAVDRRETARFGCANSPTLRAAVRPDFTPVSVIVEDASAKGLRLFCEQSLDPGVCLAVLWSFGPPKCWRTIRARVTRVTARSGGWVVGCLFDQLLQPGELKALLQFDPRATISEIEESSEHGRAVFEASVGIPISKKRTNRRSSFRKPARRSIRLKCRRGALGLGANLAIGFVDISEGGVQLLTKELLRLGEEVEVELEGHGIRARIRRLGDVRWVVPLEGGPCYAGVRFQKLLSYREVQELAQP